jgi:hypothetical protein
MWKLMSCSLNLHYQWQWAVPPSHLQFLPFVWTPSMAFDFFYLLLLIFENTPLTHIDPQANQMSVPPPSPVKEGLANMVRVSFFFMTYPVFSRLSSHPFFFSSFFLFLLDTQNLSDAFNHEMARAQIDEVDREVGQQALIFVKFNISFCHQQEEPTPHYNPTSTLQLKLTARSSRDRLRQLHPRDYVQPDSQVHCLKKQLKCVHIRTQ